jgi:RND family efflux transporter MFP subunit
VRPEDIAIAEARVEQARQAYERVLNSPTPEEIAVAEAAVETAEERVDVAEAALDAAEDCDGVGCPDEDTAEESVDVAEAQLEEAEAALEQVLAGPTEFEIESARQEIVAAETQVEKLRTGGNSDATTLALAITNAENALTGAETALQQAEAQLGQARAGYEEAQAARISALDSLGQAQAALQQAKIGEQTTQSGVMIAEAVQLSAQARLDSARNPDRFDVAAAREAVNRAQASLEELQNPDIFNIRTNQASLEQAEAQLASAQRPFTEEDIQTQQATVDQARAGVQAAQVALEETFVRAPIAGVVSEKLASEGALVGGTTPIVTLVPPGLELTVAIEEANLAAVQPGQQVTVTVAAYPDREFMGRVRTVSPTVDPQSRTVQVTIDLDDPQGLLRPGMFAQLGIVTLERTGVLVIPRSAVLNRTTQPTVFVVRENRAVQVPVVLGVSDGVRVEVTEGLNEGELVVTSGQADLADGDPVAVQTP